MKWRWIAKAKREWNRRTRMVDVDQPQTPQQAPRPARGARIGLRLLPAVSSSSRMGNVRSLPRGGKTSGAGALCPRVSWAFKPGPLGVWPPKHEDGLSHAFKACYNFTVKADGEETLTTASTSSRSRSLSAALTQTKLCTLEWANLYRGYCTWLPKEAPRRWWRRCTASWAASTMTEASQAIRWSTAPEWTGRFPQTSPSQADRAVQRPPAYYGIVMPHPAWWWIDSLLGCRGRRTESPSWSRLDVRRSTNPAPSGETAELVELCVTCVGPLTTAGQLFRIHNEWPRSVFNIKRA